MDRREFFRHAAVCSAIGVAPAFLASAVARPNVPIAGFGDDHILVVVQLGGGNDGLNTIVPYGEDTYYRLRPTLGLRGSAILPVDEHIAFNARLTGLRDLYDSGRVAIVQGVGYPNPDRSHFRSMEIWHTASGADTFLGSGWFGRYFDNHCDGSARPHAGLAVSADRPQAFEGRAGFGIATDQPARFGWTAGDGTDTSRVFEALNEPRSTTNGTLDFLRLTTQHAVACSGEVREAAERGRVASPGQRRRGLDQLDMVAGLIRGGLQTRVYYVATTGYDTHAGQLAQHDRLLAEFSEALVRFQRQIEDDGNAGRVIVLVFSEFGRRVAENGSGGTDHGTAAPVFVVGNRVRGGLHGAHPDLEDLDQGDLKFGTDFRSVYATILSGSLGVPPDSVLEENFPLLPLLG